MLMVLFNKQDLEGARTKKELKEIFNIKALKEKRTVKVHCISAITGEGMILFFFTSFKKNIYLILL